MTTLHESVTAVIVAMRSHTLDGIDGGTRIKGPELLYVLGTGELLRGTIVNRTYGTHKNQYISPFSPTIYGPIYYGPP